MTTGTNIAATAVLEVAGMHWDYLREDHILARLTLQLDQVRLCDQTAPLDPTELANYLRA